MENKFHWECGSNRWAFGKDNILPESNTEYYLRMTNDGLNTKFYAKKPSDDKWTENLVVPNDGIEYPTVKFMFGNDIDVLRQYWRGTINMDKSYIVINGNKYVFVPLG